MRGADIIGLIAQQQDLEQFRKKNWQGSFQEYLDIVAAHPEVTRNAFHETPSNGCTT